MGDLYLIRELPYRPAPSRVRQQAGQMAASDQATRSSQIRSCAEGGVHRWERTQASGYGQTFLSQEEALRVVPMLLGIPRFFRHKRAWNRNSNQAFQLYGEVAGKTIEGLGGRVVMSAPAEQVLIGHEAANWHAAAIMYFPSRGAFLQMMSDANFQKASRHRRAALSNHCMIHLNGGSFKS
jgi:uncharacterized protein (DUF1330 family)